MQRTLVCGVAVIVTTLAVFTGWASASGPAAPGKQLIDLNCEGLGSVTVSTPRGDDNNGVGQIVGAKGHGIPVAFTVTVTDVTTDTVIDTESSAVGHGHAHHNQATTTCSAVLFSGTASDVFGSGPLPPGVAAGDTIEITLEIEVIAKT